MIAFDQVKDFMLEKLTRELPEWLYYHSVDHVRDVLDAAVAIAGGEQVTDQELLLIKTAALFHDSGFIEGPKDHEQRSTQIARALLPGYGYDQAQIDAVCTMILATRIPQTPTTHLAEILADADLDYLGRDDFFPISELLFKELSYAKVVTSQEQWNQIQVRFFNAHHYFTRTSIDRRSAKKAENLSLIVSKLSAK